MKEISATLPQPGKFGQLSYRPTILQTINFIRASKNLEEVKVNSLSSVRCEHPLLPTAAPSREAAAKFRRETSQKLLALADWKRTDAVGPLDRRRLLAAG